MGVEDTDLLATAEDMRTLVDPAESLEQLVAGIGDLQEQILQMQQYSKEAAPMGAAEGGGEEEEQGGADDAYRQKEENVDPKEKLMSSMLLARPAATSVQDDMERLVGRLRKEIGKIEGTLTDKMDQVEHQIKNLPDAKPKGDDHGMAAASGDGGDEGAEDDDGANSDDMELYSDSEEAAAEHGEISSPGGSPLAGGSSFTHVKSRMRAAAASEYK